VQIIRDLDALRSGLAALRRTGGGRIAMVPTMGALHAGHMALVTEARKRADHVVVSIFVNPTQFGPNEDLSAYPRQEAQDAALLRAAGVAALWAPTVEVMYLPGFATSIHVAGISEELDGAHRPGHFDGVATVVTKLLNQVRPDIACFGEKDYQQLAVIRRLVTDTDLGVEIIGVPTQRDENGLALSSRNAYLSEAQYRQALALPNALKAAAEKLENSENLRSVLADAVGALLAGGYDSVDYVELRDAATLESLESLDRPARLLAAAKIGRTRLIDNIAVNR
jgi:pantoate--beta-alanine ligase